MGRYRPGARAARAQLACALALVLLAGLAASSALGLEAGFALRALGTAALAAAVCWPWLGGRPGGPFRGPADRVTLARAVLVTLLAAALVEPGVPSLAWAAVAAASLAALLDGVDGWLARRTGTASAFGARLDMETDALLILVLSALAWQWDKAGPWVLASGAARYLFLGAAWLAPGLRRPLPPSRRRQGVCVVQVLALIACLAPPLAHPVSAAVAALGLAALVASFAVDVAWLLARARPRPPGYADRCA